MPLATSYTVRLPHGTLSELHRELGRLLHHVDADALVLTEVGLNGGRDVYLGGLALNVRAEAGRIVISADEVR